MRRAQAHPARVGLDEEEAELCRLVALLDEEDAADVVAVCFGDPALLFVRIVAVHEVRHDARDEGLEAGVPTLLPEVQLAMALNDPSHIAGLGPAQEERFGGGYGVRIRRQRTGHR